MNNELWQMIFWFTKQQSLYLRFMTEVRINYCRDWHQSLSSLGCRLAHWGYPQSLSRQPIVCSRNDVYAVLIFTCRNSVKSHSVSLLCCLYMSEKGAGLIQCLHFRARKNFMAFFFCVELISPPPPFCWYLLKMHILPRMNPRVF